jgi:HD-like signal output (HDOD) protein
VKVLIVDDEPRVVIAIDRALRMAAPHGWTVATATSGTEALAKLDADAADVVVSDMSMPEMDGSALLSEVRVRWPATVRVILSGHSDPKAAVRVASIAHQFFEKPLPVKELVSVLRCIENTRTQLVSAPMREVLGAIGDLPGAPGVFVELNAAASDRHARIEDLTAIVSRDPALVAKILQLVSSTFFAQGTPVHDLRTAIGRLGIRLIAALALNASAFKPDASSGISHQALTDRSISIATAAHQAAGTRARAEDAFIAGLLADVGLSALACWLPARVRQARAHARTMSVPLHAAESELFGITHAEVGAYILGLWRVPPPIVETVLHHHSATAPIAEVSEVCAQPDLAHD